MPAGSGGLAAGAWLRPPVVAGHFYPATAAEIRAELAQFAAAPATAPARPGRVRGAVCPHAGWRYAGALAFQTLVQCPRPERVVILAVNHRHRHPPAWSIWPEGAWQTPLGDVAVDRELAAALMAAIPELTASAAPHAEDHATEVLLPMLQVLAEGGGGGGGHGAPLQIVPIVPFLAPGQEASAVEVGARVGAVLAQWKAPVLVVASNDMTHFAPAARAWQQDRQAIARMEALDGAGLLTTARRERITMCGAQPVAAMLAAVQVLGATQGRLVGYTHSGVVSGDDSDVVAYAGMVMD